MGNEPDPTGMIDQARKVEEWARKEIYAQGLEDTPEVFEYLIKDWMAKHGLSQFTNKHVLLNRMTSELTRPVKRPDNRVKIREIAAQLTEKAEAARERTRNVFRAREERLKAQLAEAERTIKAKDRILKNATPTKGK